MGWIKRPARNGTRVNDTARKNRMEVYNRSLWRRLRLRKVRESPLCEVCRMEGRIKAGSDVHHLRTFTAAETAAERDALAFDFGNLLTVCDECHQRLHHGDLKGATSREEIEGMIKGQKKEK